MKFSKYNTQITKEKIVHRKAAKNAKDEGNRKKENKLSKEIIGAAIEVHSHLGPGLLESAFEECLCRELVIRNLSFERKKPLPVS